MRTDDLRVLRWAVIAGSAEVLLECLTRAVRAMGSLLEAALDAAATLIRHL